MSRYEGNLPMTSLTLTQARFPAAVWPLRSWLAAALRTLLVWRERARSRRQLAGLDGRMMRDIGLDRATAVREADKGFWQA